MEKTAKAELIAALVTDKYSGFMDGDEPVLEGASDERLNQFRSAADTRRSAANDHVRLETDLRNTAARLKVAEERIKASEQPMTEEEFVQRAPQSIKATLESIKADEAELKATLVSGLKELGAHAEDDLKKMAIPELKTLAKYARLEVHDYRGKGMPVDRFAQATESYAEPPDPYKAGLDALRAAETKH